MQRAICALLAFVVLLAWGSVPQAQDTRQFYTTPIDGAGTESNPWHSRCLGMPGAGNIDLRPEVDAFLCASNDLPANMTGVEQIGPSFKSALGGKKGSLNAKFKKSLAANTVEDLIIEVVGPKLRAGRDGKLKIYLGDKVPIYQQTAWVPFRDNGLVADLGNAAMGLIEPTRAWAATFTDTFTATNNGVLTGSLTWFEGIGDLNWTTTNNTAFAQNNTPAAAEARAEHDTSTDDQAVQADMAYTYVTAGNFRCAVFGRKDSTNTRDFYQFGFQRDSGVDVYRLLERNNGSPTTLGDSSGATASSATIKLVTDGTSHAGYVNGNLTVGPVTDATISAKTRGGIAYVGGTGDNCTADNFSITDYTAPGPRSKGGAIWFQ